MASIVYVFLDPELPYTLDSNVGLDHLILITMGSNYSNIQKEYLNVTLAHPIHIAELFTPYSEEPTTATQGYTVAGLSKLLLFNAYARSHSTNFTNLVQAEAKKYPYPTELKVGETSFMQSYLTKFKLLAGINSEKI